MEDEKEEVIKQSPYAEYTAKTEILTIQEFLNFLNLVKQIDPTILDKPLNYIFDGEYQSGFSKVIFEDYQIRLVDNG